MAIGDRDLHGADDRRRHLDTRDHHGQRHQRIIRRRHHRLGSGGYDDRAASGTARRSAAPARGGHCGGTYGSLTIDAGGNWSYSLNNADANVQGLTSADTRTEVFTVSLSDGTTGNLVVTVLDWTI